MVSKYDSEEVTGVNSTGPVFSGTEGFGWVGLVGWVGSELGSAVGSEVASTVGSAVSAGPVVKVGIWGLTFLQATKDSIKANPVNSRKKRFIVLFLQNLFVMTFFIKRYIEAVYAIFVQVTSAKASKLWVNWANLSAVTSLPRSR